jgi:autotransporter-associated beta strand protein
VWESAGNITRSLGTGAGQMQVTNANSGSSGFSSANAGGMVVAIGGTAAPTALTWGGGNFTMNSLILNDTTATGPLAFRNAINLGAGNRTIVVAANVATVSGSLSGASGGLVKQGAGTLVLAGSNSYGGTTAINAGRLQVGDGGTTGSINNGSPVSVASGAALAFNRSNDLSYSGTVSGAGGLRKLGGGKLTLTSAQTFTGDTVVSAGTLALGTGATLASNLIEVGEAAGSGAVLDIGSLGSALDIGTGKTLGGYGTVAGNTVVIANSGVISPGGSVGGITIGALEFGKDGVYTFEVNDATGSAGGLLGNGWDLVAVSSAFTLSADSTDPFIINLVSLSGAGSGLAANFDGTSGSYQWKFLDANAPITNYSPDKFLLNVGGFLNPTAGSFSIAQGGLGGLGGSTTSNELYVVYVSVPEPGTLALAALGIGIVAVLACRRRRSLQTADPSLTAP